MRKASALVQRLTETLTAAADAAARGLEDLLDSVVPRPQARLVPVRVRRAGPERRG
ncbi:hypothetical protein [uncultured Methylobacterium sp.]|uniref:hypothetical protein n=1 Tax=uncultured Methylobacterium sp. TaxID=157278 RepID=UPI0035CC1C0B